MKKYLVILSVLINLAFAGLTVLHFVNKPKQLDNKKITYWLHNDEVFTKLPVERNSIVFAGDSHIERYELSELFHSLKVKNRGISYDTSTGLLNRWDEIIKEKPAKVFIEIGANDISLNISAYDIEYNVETMLNKMHNADNKAEVYLLSVLPSKYYYNKAPNVNNRLKFLAEVHKVNFIDLDPTFSNTKGLRKEFDSGDGVHLNGNGYLKLTQILLPYIKDK